MLHVTAADGIGYRLLVLVGARVCRADDVGAAALELFTRLGYEATTMADIGRAVGIRGLSLYKHPLSRRAAPQSRAGPARGV
jgi:hypothetical protein